MVRDERNKEERTDEKSVPPRPQGGDETKAETPAEDSVESAVDDPTEQVTDMSVWTRRASDLDSDVVASRTTPIGNTTTDVQLRVTTIAGAVCTSTKAIVDTVRPTGHTAQSTDAETKGNQSRETPTSRAVVTVRTRWHTERDRAVVDRTVSPDQTTKTSTEIQTRTIDRLGIDSDTVTRPMRLQEQTIGTDEELELDLDDPVFHWHGGTPYGTRRPQLIVHLDPEEYSGLPFLKRVLRDTYSELEGGRPQTASLREAHGPTSAPRIQGAIVTLDLTREEYEVSLSGESVTITSDSGTDLVELLRTAAADMYGGQLGYLIVNVSTADLRAGFATGSRRQFVEALLDSSSLSPETEDDELLELAGAPVRVAKPRVDTQKELNALVGTYFALDRPRYDRIADIEAHHDRVLSRDDWPRIALTARQKGVDAESDEHYLWKAALADGLARRLRVEYIAFHDDADENLTTAQFVQQKLLSSGILETESGGDSKSDDDIAPIPDHRLDTSERWVLSAVREFTRTETKSEERPFNAGINSGTEVVFEFETGRREGAFNYRKLRETVEKYDPHQPRWIGVIVPPRLLHRSQKRAELARKLIETWPPKSQATAEARLAVPVLDERSCMRLMPADELIDEWFGDADE